MTYLVDAGKIKWNKEKKKCLPFEQSYYDHNNIIIIIIIGTYIHQLAHAFYLNTTVLLSTKIVMNTKIKKNKLYT